MAGAPDKFSATVLRAVQGQEEHVLFWNTTLLSWLVVLASPTLSIEGDLEEITYSLCLCFSFCPLKWVMRHLLFTLLNGNS